MPAAQHEQPGPNNCASLKVQKNGKDQWENSEQFQVSHLSSFTPVEFILATVDENPDEFKEAEALSKIFNSEEVAYILDHNRFGPLATTFNNQQFAQIVSVISDEQKAALVQSLSADQVTQISRMPLDLNENQRKTVIQHAQPISIQTLVARHLAQKIQTKVGGRFYDICDPGQYIRETT